MAITHMNLTSSEARVLGCLLEKQQTTPGAYPLSLNALCLACNQSSNRDPVVQYDAAVVRDALHRLERRGFTRLASGAGSRAPKYRHLLDDALPMDSAEQALICALLLRGPQTPGELKQRTARMHAFAELSDVLGALEALIERALAERLARRPGQKEERYRQLLQAGSEEDMTQHDDVQVRLTALEPQAASARGPSPTEDLNERVARLEREVADLRAAMRNPSGGPHR